MENNTIKKLDNFLNRNEKIKKTPLNGKETEVCDLNTGDCYVIKSKDGIVEKMDKKFITNDGRQLLQD